MKGLQLILQSFKSRKLESFCMRHFAVLITRLIEQENKTWTKTLMVILNVTSSTALLAKGCFGIPLISYL